MRRGFSSTPPCSSGCAAGSATRWSSRRGRPTCSSELERANSFVVPLDRRGEWYRYHHLFAELLRTELERAEPDVATELNRRAMAWCIAHDHPEAAVVYGHAAGETDAVAALVDALALPTHYDGRMETLEGWLRWFSEDDLRRYPALAVEGGWLRALTGRAAEAEAWLALADGSSSTIPLSDGSETIEPWVAILRAGMMPDGVDRALVDSDLALAGARCREPMEAGRGRPPGHRPTRCSAPPRARPTTSRRRSPIRAAPPSP